MNVSIECSPEEKKEYQKILDEIDNNTTVDELVKWAHKHNFAIEFSIYEAGLSDIQKATHENWWVRQMVKKEEDRKILTKKLK